MTLDVVSSNFCAATVEGAALPSQTRPSPDGSASYELAFVAEQVPALGFATFYIQKCSTSIPTVEVYSSGDVILENDYYSLTIDASTGMPALLVDKQRDLSLPMR